MKWKIGMADWGGFILAFSEGVKGQAGCEWASCRQVTLWDCRLAWRSYPNITEGIELQFDMLSWCSESAVRKAQAASGCHQVRGDRWQCLLVICYLCFSREYLGVASSFSV